MSGEAQRIRRAATEDGKSPNSGSTASISHPSVLSGERPFACNLCDSKFTQKGHRDAHIRRVHLKNHTVSCSWSGCGKLFIYPATMRKHVAAVHKKQRFACSVAGCTHSSAWKSAIENHIQGVHAEAKCFACSVEGCSYKSKFRKNLLDHKRVVHEKRQVACVHDGCDYRTSWPQSMKQHVELAHEKKLLHACHVCDKRFFWKSSVRAHLQSHAKQGHPVAECASCQESLVKGIKRSSLVTQEEQPSSTSDSVSDFLTSVHLDLHLLSTRH